MKVRRFVPIWILVLVVLVGGWALLKLTHPISTGSLQLNCVQLPPDDTVFAQWLSSQPQVVASSVSRNNGIVVVTFKKQGRDADVFAKTVLDQSKQQGYAVNGYSLSTNANPFQ